MHQKKYPDHQTIIHITITVLYLCEICVSAFISPHFPLIQFCCGGVGVGVVPCMHARAAERNFAFKRGGGCSLLLSLRPLLCSWYWH